MLFLLVNIEQVSHQKKLQQLMPTDGWNMQRWRVKHWRDLEVHIILHKELSLRIRLMQSVTLG
jgi:hypothetical protein